MEKKLRKNWYLGFLGFMSLFGIRYFQPDGHWHELIWFGWVIWFAYFIPIRSEG